MAYEKLAKYLPEGSGEKVIELLKQYPLQLRLVPGRKTKLGDYRPPARQGRFHRISVNLNLNRYAFLIILLHEIAHMQIWMRYKRKAKPHGAEWKACYRGLLKEYMDSGVFPPGLELPLKHHMIKAHASFTSDIQLMKALEKYDHKKTNGYSLEEIPIKTKFQSADGKVFIKGEKLRTRYRCYCVTNKRSYTIHPMAKIIPVEQE
ncbi:MAG: SprT-like domain-containing protein [Bacteroidales bacterium]|nr:SprT-like domain-containing protein [Bacteroidales bacterium]